MLAPHSVAQSKFLKRREIVSCQALPLKNKTLFPCPPSRSCFKSNLLVYLERAQNTEPIFDQDRLGGDRSSTTGSRAMRSQEYAAEQGALIDRTWAPRWP
jgi:hypothetical protein